MKKENAEVPLGNKNEELKATEEQNLEVRECHEKEDKTGKKKSVFAEYWRWPLLVLIIATSLSFSFSILSEMTMTGTSVAIEILVIIAFILIAILTDIIAVAVTVAKIGPFRAMASKKVRGSKEAIKLVQNAEKVASVTADIIGDICAILSGSAGAALAMVFIGQNEGSFIAVIIASAVSAVVAGLAIFGKALGKKYAIKNSEKIVLVMGKVVSVFHKKKKKQKKVKLQDKKDENSTLDHQNEVAIDKEKSSQ